MPQAGFRLRLRRLASASCCSTCHTRDQRSSDCLRAPPAPRHTLLAGGGEGSAAALRRRAGRLGAPFTATRDALADPALRRLQLGWAGSTTGEYISVVAFGVVAYEAGAVALDAPVTVLYVLAAALAVAGGALFPAQMALVPLLARPPDP